MNDHSLNNNIEKKEGTLILKEREEMALSGVEDILSFDENALSLCTALGELYIDGENLKITALSLEEGTIGVTGRISGFYYVDTENKKKKKKVFGGRS